METEHAGCQEVSMETNGITMFQHNGTLPFKLYYKMQHMVVVVFILEKQDSMEVKAHGFWTPSA